MSKLNMGILLVLATLTLVTTTLMLTGYDKKANEQRSILEKKLGNRG
jgi:hypothetical protein